MTDIGNDPATLPFATIGIDLHFDRLKLIVCNQNSGCGCGRWWLWWVGGPHRHPSVNPVATPAALIDMSYHEFSSKLAADACKQNSKSKTPHSLIDLIGKGIRTKKDEGKSKQKNK